MNGDRAALIGVALLGGQDTLYSGTQRVYLENSFINGSCDSLFGEGSMVCELLLVCFWCWVDATDVNVCTK